MSTKRRANGSPSRSTHKPNPASPAKSAGAAASLKKVGVLKRQPANSQQKSPPKAAKPVQAKVTKAKAPAKAIALKKPAANGPASGKSRQLAASTKSGIEMKAKQAAVPVARPAAATKPKAAQSNIVLPENYQPSDAEPFMSTLQRYYFKLKLLSWKEDILRQTRETLQGMVDDTLQYADLADRATSETDRALELRARDRQRKLIAKIDAALARIEDGTYGYCEETGEPIGLKRLDARPIATLSLEAQERHERRERVHRGD